MLDRSSFNNYDVVINHLDDTAIVATDNGEFGIWFRTVSDDILETATWKTREARNKTIDAVLTRHNYLRSAFTVLRLLEPQEKYYSYIKDMATRPRRLTDDGYELDFDDIEYALYGLAKFKKQDDAQIIKERMMTHVWKLSDVSFRLLKEYPDTAYFDVLWKYHRRQFYRFSGNRPHGFTGIIADRAAPEDFIEALVMQKSGKSAELLDTMLNLLPKQTCMPDMENIKDKVIMEIWDHPCAAYERLREKIRPKAESLSKRHLSFQLPPDAILMDTSKRVYRWYN